MNLIQLADNTYHLRAGSNAGLLVQDGRALKVLVYQAPELPGQGG